MDLIIDRSKIPQKEWKWDENEIGYEGVNTNNNGLKWFTYRHAHRGNTLSFEQTYEDFIREGPLKESIPADIMVDLYDCIMNAVSGGGGMLF
jgi:hypothetical protein